MMANTRGLRLLTGLLASVGKYNLFMLYWSTMDAER